MRYGEGKKQRAKLAANMLCTHESRPTTERRSRFCTTLRVYESERYTIKSFRVPPAERIGSVSKQIYFNALLCAFVSERPVGLLPYREFVRVRFDCSSVSSIVHTNRRKHSPTQSAVCVCVCLCSPPQASLNSHTDSECFRSAYERSVCVLCVCAVPFNEIPTCRKFYTPNTWRPFVWTNIHSHQVLAQFRHSDIPVAYGRVPFS